MIAKILTDVWIFIQIVIGYNLFIPVILFLIYVVKGKTKIKPASTTPHDYAIIVTAYEQTEPLHAVVHSILQLNYTNYIIYIVADKCDVSTLKFEDPRVVVLRPPETLASNTGSHFYAIRNFKREHDILTIIDSDNLVDGEYLNELNKYFDAGYSAVQGIRKAKNLDTTFACLDASRDIYYHFYDGEVLFNVGSSATLAGSGMAFTTSLYRQCLEHQDITGAGFDKVLQMEIVSRGYRIAFCNAAIVYDEKTTKSDQLVKQRARWINTWFRYFVFGFSLLWDGIRKGSFSRFLFGIILLRPPLFIFLILSMVFTAIALFTSKVAFMLWLAGFGCFIGGFLIAIIHARPDKRIVRSLLSIPVFVFYQILSLMHIKRANKLSVATHHFSDKTINDIKK